MKLIADSGSTKTDWTLINTPHPQKCDVVATFHTQGITPIHQQPDVIRQIIGHELISQLSTFPRASLIQSGVLESPLMSNIEVFFYGSGCTPTHVPMMKRMLGEVFSSQNIEVHSDLTAAARALCQHEPGIACILGTGANSCLYDGQDIIQNTPALGYILGDEGSGSVLGRLFMNAIFKNPAFADVCPQRLPGKKQTYSGRHHPESLSRAHGEPFPGYYIFIYRGTFGQFVALRPCGAELPSVLPQQHRAL